MNNIFKYLKLYYNKKKRIIFLIVFLNVLSLSLLLFFNLFIQRENNLDPILGLVYSTIYMVFYSFLSILIKQMDSKNILYEPLYNIMTNSYTNSLQRLKNSHQNHFHYSVDLPQQLIPLASELSKVAFSILKLVIVGIAVGFYSLNIILIVLIASFSFDIILFLIEKRLSNYFKEINIASSKYMNSLVNVFNNMDSIKYSGFDKIVANEINNQSNNLKNKNLKFNHLMNNVTTLKSLKILVFQLLTIVLLFSFSNEFALFEVANFMFLVSLIAESSYNSILSFVEIKKLYPHLDSHFNLFDKEAKQVNKPKLHSNQVVNLKNASIKIDNKTILSNINFELYKGDKVAVVGQNGSGKSSLLKHIATMITDDSDSDPSKLGCVWSKPHIFNVSFKDNILFDKTYSKSEFRDILSSVLLKDFFNSINNDCETIIDVNNLTISDGETMKIALARTLAIKKSILILDEFSRSIDSESEILISNSIFNNKDRTLLVATNRISTAMKFDRLYYLPNDSSKPRFVSKDEAKDLLAVLIKE